MEMIKCYLYDNRCMTTGKQSCTPIGIVVHSTGVNNKYIKRYIQPSKSDIYYNELIAKIGKNKYNNSWNRSTVSKSIHYMIGTLADGTVGVVHSLPDDICAWGVGKGKSGSYNYPPTAHIQIEVCEDNLKDEDYFYNCYNKLVELCANICINNKLKVEQIVSHKEAHNLGYASNHKDIDHWFSKFNKTMDNFRVDVGIAMNFITKNNFNAPANIYNFNLTIGDKTYEITGRYRQIK